MAIIFRQPLQDAVVLHGVNAVVTVGVLAVMSSMFREVVLRVYSINASLYIFVVLSILSVTVFYLDI